MTRLRQNTSAGRHPLRIHRYVTLPIALSLVSFAACSRQPSPGDVAIQLIDRFDARSVEGLAPLAKKEPSALWNFSTPGDNKDPLLGWKAGSGVTGLRVVDGKLMGQSTSASPLIYASVPDAVDIRDNLHSVEARIRVDKGERVIASPAGRTPDFAAMQTRDWTLAGSLAPGDSFNTAVLRDTAVRTMGQFQTLVLSPVDVAGANFEIESIRLVSQGENRDSIPSGVGWQGLSNIFHETIVARSPESFTMQLDLPRNAWLDLSVGTVQSAPITFKVEAVSGNNSQLLLQQTVTTPHRWEHTPVDLSALSGSATLRLSLSADENSTLGFWGSPVIRSRGAKPYTETTPAAALGGAEPPQGVIIFLADTLRSDHLSFDGHARKTTPQLAAMASEGAVFRDAIAQATWTKVSVPSILTSLYPTSHRVSAIPHRISAAATTLAEIYRKAGYATVSFPSNAFAGTMTNLHQGFEEMHEAASFDRDDFRAKTARSVVDRALTWLERHADAPFFMYVHVTDPHSPFKPRPPYDTLYADPAKREQHAKNWEHLRGLIASPFMRSQAVATREEVEKAGIDPDEWLAYEKDYYDGSIHGMDAEIGRIRESLRRLGIEGKVLFGFLSDHGEEFQEHGRMFHGHTAYGDLANVPLMIHWPAVIPAGTEITESVRTIDFMPTLLELSGLTIPEKAQGQSLLPLIAAARQNPGNVASAAQNLGWVKRPAVTEKNKRDGDLDTDKLDAYALVLDGWKLIHNVEGATGQPEFELFNHREDPLNLKDVASEHPEIVEKLKADLAAWREMAEQAKLPEGDSTEGLPPDEINRLRTLGYIQ